MSWFSNFFKPKQEFDTEQRAVRAAESILNNESLTSDLDDEVASLLIDWGLTWAEQVAHNTSRLDDEAARENMEAKLKAIRKIMRLVTRWGTNLETWDEMQTMKTLTMILEQRSMIFEEDLPPTPQGKSMYLPELHFENPAQLIKQLQLLLGFRSKERHE